MNLRLIAVILLLSVFALFVAVNWSAFAAVDELNFVIRRVEAPLGLLLLGFIVLLCAVFAVYAASLRTSALVESRRNLKELEAARKLADEVEASRISSLQETVASEMAELREMLTAEALATREQLEESRNILTAHLEQIDDYLKLGHDAGADADAGQAAVASTRGTDEGVARGLDADPDRS
ncbi:MAG: LapA family protein [Anaerolineae bacterium]|jgi:uncharacterized integral membrane protein